VLDLARLALLLLPRSCRVHRIRYYTARVSGRPGNPEGPRRQEVYFRALRTIPNLTIAYGHFLTSEVNMPLARPRRGGPATVRVIKTEEKGSDVNLASHLLLDAFRGDCEVAFVISNDSDFFEPVRIARREFGLQVGIGCPHERPSQVLLREADFIRPIRAGVLRVSQFPSTLSDEHGVFSKPASW
jgi:NYN domain-containing protein